MSGSTMTWYDAIWDSTVSGNPAPDTYDGSLTEDYDGAASSAVSYPDQVGSSNYCHDLVEGGYSDWRMPTNAELAGGIGSGAGAVFFPETVMGISSYFWSSTTSSISPDGANAFVVFFGSGSNTSSSKSNATRVICVRRGT